jgi:short subunit dehydrogenase-like uncharacterized protein
MQLEYNQQAINSNTYIIGSCGFDSIPADIGFLYTKNLFDGQLAYVESYLSIDSNGSVSFGFFCICILRLLNFKI